MIGRGMGTLSLYSGCLSALYLRTLRRISQDSDGESVITPGRSKEQGIISEVGDSKRRCFIEGIGLDPAKCSKKQ